MKIAENKDCTGCGACASVCPKQCIDMNLSLTDGFYYPVVNASLCINCGLCKKSCHALSSHEQTLNNAEYFACWASDENSRKEGSSGGIFGILADNIISKGGIVYGASFFDKCHFLKHVSTDVVELQFLKKSKYIESYMGKVIAEIIEQLRNDRIALFCGTPCQSMGVRQAIGYQNSNLLIVDFLCHGVPSQAAYKKYIEELENRYHSKVVDVSFRSKIYGWKAYCIVVRFENGKEYIKTANEDPYFTRFFKNQGLRESCYNCNRVVESEADITIGDYWNVSRSQLGDNDKGVSLVILRTENGANLFKSLGNIVSFKLEMEDVEDAFTKRVCLPKSEEISKSFFDNTFKQSLKIIIQSFLIKHRITRWFFYKIISLI